MPAAPSCQRDGDQRVLTELHRAGAAEQCLQARALPQPHAGGDMACPVLPEGADLGRKLVDDLIKAAKPVAAWIIPERGEDSRPGEQLHRCQVAGAAGQGLAILGQAPAGIEGLAENLGTVAVQDCLEAELGRHCIDCARLSKQPMGRHRRGQKHHPAARICRPIVPWTQALYAFGMAADHDARFGVFPPGYGQHVAERVLRRGAVPDRRIAARLVDDQDVARVRDWQVRVMNIVF